MMRPRKKDRNLPPCVYLKHGAYWHVKAGKWTRLGDNMADALREYVILSSPQQVGMADLIARAHVEIIRNVKPNTARQYEAAKHRLIEILAEFKPEQVRMKDVAAIKTHYAGTPNMANRLLSYLRLVFAYAVEWQVVETNPCVGVKRHVEAKRTRYLSDDELAAIRRHATDNLRAIIDIAYLTGQRVGDVLAIRLNDISAEGIAFQQEKTGARLQVVMTQDLTDAIARAKALPRPVRGLTLFCTMRGGRPYAYSTVRDMYHAAAIKAKVEDTTFHDLRAKSLTDAKRDGKNPTALGGHSSPAMTARYLRNHETVLADPPSFRHMADN